MNPNHHARKKRQLKALVEKLKYFMDCQNEEPSIESAKLLVKIKNLVKELALVISKPAIIKILGTAAIFIGISCANPSFAQSFGPPVTNPFGLLSTIEYPHPGLADLDGDGDVDLLVGGYQGSIEYLENIGSATDPQFGAPQMNPFGLDSCYLYIYSPSVFMTYFIPSFADLDNDGDLDLLIGGHAYESNGGKMAYFENIGDSLNPQFDVPQSSPFGLVGVGSGCSSAVPAFADLDGDGDSDLLVGDVGNCAYQCNMTYFECTGSSANPQFSAPQMNPYGLVPTFVSAAPSFADLDMDGDMDLLVREAGGNFKYFENIGDSLNPQFADPQINPFGIAGVGGFPAFADLDGDGDEDLLIGSGNDILYFKNTTVEGECPANLTFTCQAQLDSLHADYPNCTEIKGNVVINGSDISNLDGLTVITAVWGDLSIGDIAGGCNPGLMNLTGLQNLDSIGGSLSVSGNTALTGLSGLSNEISITGDIKIINNTSLPDLTGLEVLTSIGGDLLIYINDALTSLAGLDNLHSIDGNLEIDTNSNLSCFSGLNNLDSIGGDLAFQFMSSFEGLESLVHIGGDLTLSYDNPISLSGLDNLYSIGGTLRIAENDSLSDLSGLENLASIGEGLIIDQNDSLASLTGLENLETIDSGGLLIGSYAAGGGNPSLSDLSALSSLNSIGGGLFIDFNPMLQSLAGLGNLVSINGPLMIRANGSLNDITGLKDIDPGSINDLEFMNNFDLSECAIESVCIYLADPNGTVSISNNAPGCESFDEVWDICYLSVEEPGYANQDNLKIIPNPLESYTTITYTLQENSSVTLKILDLSGREMARLVDEIQHQGEQKVVLNTTGLKPGNYFCVLKTNEGMQTKKMVKR